MVSKKWVIEVLTPRQNEDNLEAGLDRFAQRYETVVKNGYVVSIPDNSMGKPHFRATEVISELGLPVIPEQLLIHLNTFHTKEDLQNILTTAAEIKARNLLVITGDGSERLTKLSPDSIGIQCNSVTSVELLRHIAREYPGKFTCGVVFNPYEPLDHEVEKMHRKIEAGAKFAITQPLIGRDDRFDSLRDFNLPIVIGAWMSRNTRLLSDCIGYPLPEDLHYDPIENLKELRRNYPDYGLYLSLLNLGGQLPSIKLLLN